jgi:hypothetical protein
MIDSGTFWLKLNYFKLTHIEDMRKWWVIVLAALDVFLLVFCVTRAVVYVMDINQQQNIMQSMAADTVDYQAIRSRVTPSPLVVETTAAIPTGNGMYNLVAKVKNPNAGWAGSEVTFIFTVNGQATTQQTDFILPNSEKYFVASSVAGPSSITASFTLQGVKWQRVPDSQSLGKTAFSVNDLSFSDSAVVDSATVRYVRGTISNTGYTSLWQAKFTVVLLEGDKIVGIGYARFEQFKAGEEKPLNVQVTINGSPTSAVVVPDINVLDANNFIK